MSEQSTPITLMAFLLNDERITLSSLIYVLRSNYLIRVVCYILSGSNEVHTPGS